MAPLECSNMPVKLKNDFALKFSMARSRLTMRAKVGVCTRPTDIGPSLDFGSFDPYAAVKTRLQFMLEHKKNIQNQIDELKKCTELIDFKIWYYETAIEAGTADIHKMEKSS